MPSETPSSDKTVDLQVEKADTATEKHGDIAEGDHHLLTRKILWNLDIR
jgi:hypothetical protein